MSPAEGDQFASGGYDNVLAAAAEAGFPIFVFAPDRPAAFARAAEKFPGLRIIVDHCGIYSNSMRTGFAELPALSDEEQQALFDEICALARYPNLALKWGHASGHFATPAWPGEKLWPVLRRAIDAFGKKRVMWASDHSVNQRGESWADLLYGVLGAPDLASGEREWVLGKALRNWIGWPAG
jgi:predicted TIM-barrel fold metal-dependent hydrolase